jgi:glutamate-1-semialdehyde 2,1-aminomutase
VLPVDGFLEGLRDLTREYGALLIFDEVITGFRVSRGGAAELSGIIPDLVTLGKILGGGLPIGAVGGKHAIMEKLAPVGDVYQAGTLSGNPLSVAAGIATLKELEEPSVYERLQITTESLAEGMEKQFERSGIAARVSRSTGLLTVFFSTILPANFNTVKGTDAGLFARFFHKMLQQGIYLPPSPYEAWFLSTAHSSSHSERALEAAESAVKTL